MAAVYSFEHSRSKSYSADIRWRMVYQRLMSGLTYEQIAANLNVDPSTVWRTVRKFEEDGTVEAGKHEGEKTRRGKNTKGKKLSRFMMSC